MTKVKVHFKITTTDYYNRVKYRTRTIDMEIVKDEWNNELPGLTLNKAMDIIRKEHIPAMKLNVVSSSPIWMEIVR